MTQRADFIGELALGVLSGGGVASATRVFPGAVYVRSKDDFLLLLWGGLKSPMTINMSGGRSAKGPYTAGERFELSSRGLESAGGTISIKGAVVHRGALRRRRDTALPSSGQLAKGVAMLKSLYDVSPSGPALARDSAFGNFVTRTLIPHGKGSHTGIYDFSSYLGLVGKGGGFTPAGDDFVSGFTATLNYLARSTGSKQVRVPKREVLSETVPESGAILAYSSRGYVDEVMEGLILASLAPSQPGFYNELLAVASRGHTSGVDMALGVLMCEAASAERERRDGTLKRCVAAL